MQWTTLWAAAAGAKVAHRLTSACDLSAFSGQVAIGSDPAVLPGIADRGGVWLTTSPMPETVKDVGADGLVRQTVPRDGLSIAGFPVVAPARLLAGARDPDDLLRRLIRSGEPLQRL